MFRVSFLFSPMVVDKSRIEHGSALNAHSPAKNGNEERVKLISESLKMTFFRSEVRS